MPKLTHEAFVNANAIDNDLAIDNWQFNHWQPDKWQLGKKILANNKQT